MPTEFRLPELGEGITEADVIRVLVHPGDAVAVDVDGLDNDVCRLDVDDGYLTSSSSTSNTSVADRKSVV